MQKWRNAVLGALLIAPLLAITTGCTMQAPEPDRPAVTPQAPAPDVPLDGCPVAAPPADGPTVPFVTIDFVDFIDHDGRQYLAGYTDASPVDSADLGEVVLLSRCSFSAFNERTGQDPGQPRDGDTAFLTQGTEIRAVNGWAPECRLAAERDGRLFVYLALDPSADRAQPAECALG